MKQAINRNMQGKRAKINWTTTINARQGRKGFSFCRTLAGREVIEIHVAGDSRSWCHNRKSPLACHPQLIGMCKRVPLNKLKRVGRFICGEVFLSSHFKKCKQFSHYGALLGRGRILFSSIWWKQVRLLLTNTGHSLYPRSGICEFDSQRMLWIPGEDTSHLLL